MMDAAIDPVSYLDTTQAAKIAPGRPHAAVVWRWMSKGIKDRKSGQRVRLRHIRIGGKLLTTQAWLGEFVQELTRLGDLPRDTPPALKQPRKPTAARRARQIADARLALSRS